MIKLAVLIDMFFKDLSWKERVAQIARAGFEYVETWQGKDAAPLDEISQAGKSCGVQLVSIVINSAKEDQVAPIRAENLERFLEQVDRCADNALAAGCRQGIVTAGQAVPGRPAADQRQALVAALQAAADKIRDRKFLINLEPLNTVVDHVGYFLDDSREGLAIVREVDRPAVRLLYDVYHMTIMGGNQTVLIEEQLDWIGHFHAAGTPGRHEPFEGEFNYPFLLRRLAAAGYAGCMGLEYKPSLPSQESLARSLEYFSLIDS